MRILVKNGLNINLDSWSWSHEDLKTWKCLTFVVINHFLVTRTILDVTLFCVIFDSSNIVWPCTVLGQWHAPWYKIETESYVINISTFQFSEPHPHLTTTIGHLQHSPMKLATGKSDFLIMFLCLTFYFHKCFWLLLLYIYLLYDIFIYILHDNWWSIFYFAAILAKIYQTNFSVGVK